MNTTAIAIEKISRLISYMECNKLESYSFNNETRTLREYKEDLEMLRNPLGSKHMDEGNIHLPFFSYKEYNTFYRG